MQKSGKPLDLDQAARRRGRPRAFDRQAALTSATRLFWRKGFEATSIADLTEVMGIGSPSLYAAFHSKEALYAEALNHYVERYEALAWARFRSAGTAREAVMHYLLDSAAALTEPPDGEPQGCMVTLSSVGCEGYPSLGELVRSARAVTLDRLEERLRRGVAEGQLSSSVDLRGLARFVQAVQSGMSILARDGACRVELEAAAQIAMLGWDARVGGAGAEAAS